MANNSAQVKQLKALQKMADDSIAVNQLKAPHNLLRKKHIIGNVEPVQLMDGTNDDHNQQQGHQTSSQQQQASQPPATEEFIAWLNANAITMMQGTPKPPNESSDDQLVTIFIRVWENVNINGYVCTVGVNMHIHNRVLGSCYIKTVVGSHINSSRLETSTADSMRDRMRSIMSEAGVGNNAASAAAVSTTATTLESGGTGSWAAHMARRRAANQEQAEGSAQQQSDV